MAEMTNGPEMDGVAFDGGALMRVAGAAVSLGLLVGMGVWGYKLVVRDATGIPIVRAMDGPMREAPSNPGGTLPLNTGLAVNDVAAGGGVSAPEDMVLLAPQASGLIEEDLLTQPTAEADEVRPGEILVVPQPQPTDSLPASLGVAATDPIEVAPTDGQMTAAQILALADQIASGVDPLEALSQAQVVPPTLTVDGQLVADASTRISADIPGVTLAVRPPARPAGLVTVTATPGAIPTAPSVEVSAIETLVAEAQAAPDIAAAAPIVVGTTLVQLGAYDTLDEAQNVWAGLNGRFSDFMVGKDIVIQEAESGGSQFYRLRAMGFTGIDDARRFCSALVAEEAACIPVVVQ